MDPFLCTGCGRRISLLAFVTDAFAIRKILDHLGLSTPEAENPLPQRAFGGLPAFLYGWTVLP